MREYKTVVRFQWYGLTTENKWKRSGWGGDTEEEALKSLCSPVDMRYFELVKETTTYEIIRPQENNS